MIIKKFSGKTQEEAIAAAKKELGGGIVVMNAKETKPRGLFAFMRPRVIEVTVALEEEQDSSVFVRKETLKTGLAGATASGAAASGAVAPGEPDRTESRTAERFSFEGNQNIEQKLDTLQDLLIKQFQLKETENLKKEEVSLSQEKQEEAAGKSQPEEDTEQERFIRLLYNTMIDNEVDEKYANQILEEIDKTLKPNIPMDYILANVYQKMILKFGRSEGITPSEEGPKLVLFIGPTGVGKTTTIAKIASHYAVGEKKKVALITADTYRIAAAEQLRTYASILEVPFRVVYTPEELKNAISEFEEYDYIFVDTAGHSHQNVQQLDKMKDLLRETMETMDYQAFLVLSAATKYKDLLKIAENYREITNYQLIFTKLDETVTQGNLLNLKLYTDTPIAFVTCGQNVPDDIEQFNPQKTVKQLLGGKG